MEGGFLKEYVGAIDRKQMSPIVLKGYKVLCSQGKRCAGRCLDKVFRKKASTYFNKGIKVEYTSRQFLAWWVENYVPNKFKRPVVGRKDHSKNYSLDNIEIAENADNSRESILRNKVHLLTKNTFKAPIAAYKNGEWVVSFMSIRDTARYFNVSQRLIQFLVRGKYESSKLVDCKLKYVEGFNAKNVGPRNDHQERVAPSSSSS